MKVSGKLRIGDHHNAISIIALSQSNPLKAVAEFIENSIDAGAREITLLRGREKGQSYLVVRDDGRGIPQNDEGVPDFQYVATHICDSLKRKLKEQGEKGIQGEFGIGLLSFWTVGEALTLTSSGADGKTYQMQMRKGETHYEIEKKKRLFAERGTELKIAPLLSGIRHFSGEKIEWYLSSELRDRIRTSGVKIRIIDRVSRTQHDVEPRKFSGRLLHELPLPKVSVGDFYLEIYLTSPDPKNRIALYRSGTRVLEDIAQLEVFQKTPWSSGYFEGIIDASFLTLTPGTRLGVIQDEAFFVFCTALAELEQSLLRIIEEQQRAEEEKTSVHILQSIQKAIKAALLKLPEEEYDWFDLTAKNRSSNKISAGEAYLGETTQDSVVLDSGQLEDVESPQQKAFFQFPGALDRVRIVPGTAILPVQGSKNFRVICQDRKGVVIEKNLTIKWQAKEGQGSISPTDQEMMTYFAPEEPALESLEVEVRQGDIACVASAVVTVTASLLPKTRGNKDAQGMPGYTYQRAPGELWRSRYDAEQNVIIINNAHRDFVYASKTRVLKLKYIVRLFAKELVYKNFPGLPADQLLERQIELTLYTEENL